MLTFLAIAISIFGLVNFYIGRRGAQALSHYPAARTVFLVLFIAMALAYPLARVLRALGKDTPASWLLKAGSYHMVMMLCGFFALVLIDLVRLANSARSVPATGPDVPVRPDGPRPLSRRRRSDRADHRGRGMERRPAEDRRARPASSAAGRDGRSSDSRRDIGSALGDAHRPVEARHDRREDQCPGAGRRLFPGRHRRRDHHRQDRSRAERDHEEDPRALWAFSPWPGTTRPTAASNGIWPASAPAGSMFFRTRLSGWLTRSFLSGAGTQAP